MVVTGDPLVTLAPVDLAARAQSSLVVRARLSLAATVMARRVAQWMLVALLAMLEAIRVAVAPDPIPHAHHARLSHLGAVLVPINMTTGNMMVVAALTLAGATLPAVRVICRAVCRSS